MKRVMFPNFVKCKSLLKLILRFLLSFKQSKTKAYP